MPELVFNVMICTLFRSEGLRNVNVCFAGQNVSKRYIHFVLNNIDYTFYVVTIIYKWEFNSVIVLFEMLMRSSPQNTHMDHCKVDTITPTNIYII